MATSRTRRMVPVLREAEFREIVAEPGATVEIECLEAPDPTRRYRGQWVFYVHRGPDERYLLVTSLTRERIMHTMEGVVAFAATKLELGSVTVPLITGSRSTGMYRRRPVTN